MHLKVVLDLAHRHNWRILAIRSFKSYLEFFLFLDLGLRGASGLTLIFGFDTTRSPGSIDTAHMRQLWAPATGINSTLTTICKQGDSPLRCTLKLSTLQLSGRTGLMKDKYFDHSSTWLHLISRKWSVAQRHDPTKNKFKWRLLPSDMALTSYLRRGEINFKGAGYLLNSWRDDLYALITTKRSSFWRVRRATLCSVSTSPVECNCILQDTTTSQREWFDLTLHLSTLQWTKNWLCKNNDVWEKLNEERKIGTDNYTQRFV